MDVLMQDLRYAFRSLARAKGFAAVVVVVMGLGLGVNLLVFAMVDSMLFRPWALPQSERIVSVRMTDPAHGDERDWSFQNFHELRSGAKSFSALGGFYQINCNVTIDRDPERFAGVAITSGLFPALGVLPALGRNFREDEEVWGRNWNQVIISDRVWHMRFHADPHVLGRTLRLNGRTRAVVGVMPPGFRYPEVHDFWIPVGFNVATDQRTDSQLRGVGRLAPGATIASADAEVKTFVAGLGRRWPDLRPFSSRVMNLQESWIRGIRPTLIVMLLAVIFVLLIACANVANLMLARAAVRRREISMRLALGATRGRIVRQLLTEGLVLAVMGAVLGRLLAHWAGLWEYAAIPVEKPWFLDFSIGLRAYGFIGVVTVLATIAAGLAPALHAADTHLGESLREGGIQGGTSRSQRRLRNGLVVAEIAMSLVLLVGAGLMVRTMQRFQAEGQSLRADGLVVGRVLLPIAAYPDDAARRNFFREVTSRLDGGAGVTEVSGMNVLPLGRDGNDVRLLTPGHEDPTRGVRANMTVMLSGALRAVGVRLLRGREFLPSDDERSARVALVSTSLARQLWPGQDPIGQRVRYAEPTDTLGWHTVVGVAADVTQDVENDHPTLNTVYVPELQEPWQGFTMLVRSRDDGTLAAAALRRAVRELAPDVPVTELRSLREELHFSLWVRRLFGTMIGAFGVIALLIAGVGLYGVMAYSVAQRTQEIGIRMALGADAAGVQRMVVGGALRLTLLGVGIGLVVAFGTTRFMASTIQTVSPTDPPTFTIVTVLLMLSGLVAAWVPSLRATRVDPMRALRTE